MSLILAVDGGNSKTLAVIARETGEVVGVGRSGGSNHQSFGGLARALEQIRLAVQRALAAADAGPDVAAAFFCLAGADLTEDFEMLEPALANLGFAPRVGLDNDSVAILRSGTDSPNAVAVGWGAGNTAVGRNAEGRRIRLPALGWISGDWGGGSDLTQETIWLVARAHDGRGEPTLLSELVYRALDVPNGDEMIRKLYFARDSTPELNGVEGAPVDMEDELLDSIQLAPLIFQAANAGDRVARRVVERAGREVAITATALLRRLDLIDRPADVVLGGSVFKAEGSLLVNTARDRLAESAPRARIIVPTLEPVIGAIFCALDMLEIPVDHTTRETALRSYEKATSEAGTEVRA